MRKGGASRQSGVRYVGIYVVEINIAIASNCALKISISNVNLDQNNFTQLVQFIKTREKKENQERERY